MRTTIDLPEELHALARQLAHDGRRSMSDVVVELIRRGLGGDTMPFTSNRRGMPLVTVGRVVSAEDVRTLEDE